jgi:hypothetical protein
VTYPVRVRVKKQQRNLLYKVIQVLPLPYATRQHPNRATFLNAYTALSLSISSSKTDSK